MSLDPLSQPASSFSYLGSQILQSQSKELRLDGKPLVVTLDILESCYDLPLYAAAAKLGICITAIKKVCRKLGVTKWPYREMRLQREGGAASAGVADPGELESDVGESSNNEDDEEGDAGVVDDGGSDHEEFSRVDSSGSAVGIQGWSVLMAAAHRISEEVEKQEQASLKAEKATAKEEGVLDPPPPDPQQATMAASVQTTTDAEQEPQDGGPEPLDAST